MNFLENNLEIRYSKEPNSDFDILNNKEEEIELENLSSKRIKNSLQLRLM